MDAKFTFVGQIMETFTATKQLHLLLKKTGKTLDFKTENTLLR